MEEKSEDCIVCHGHGAFCDGRAPHKSSTSPPMDEHDKRAREVVLPWADPRAVLLAQDIASALRSTAAAAVAAEQKRCAKTAERRLSCPCCEGITITLCADPAHRAREAARALRAALFALPPAARSATDEARAAILDEVGFCWLTPGEMVPECCCDSAAQSRAWRNSEIAENRRRLSPAQAERVSEEDAEREPCACGMCTVCELRAEM